MLIRNLCIAAAPVRNPWIRPAVIAMAGALGLASSHAQGEVALDFVAESSADFLVGQDEDNFVVSLAGDFGTTGQSASFSDTFEFGDEETGVMSVEGSASAAAGFGVLRASAFGVITNPISDPDAEPYVEPDGGINEFGLPDLLGFTGFAETRDMLSYGGEANNYTSSYAFRVTGNLSGTGFAVVTVQHASNAPQQFIFDTPGTIDQEIQTQAWIHGRSPQQLTIQLQASADFFPDFDFDGDVASADFGSTLELLGVELRDADTGELLSSETVSSASGNTFAIVPEPGTAMILIAGLTGVLSVRPGRRSV